MQDIGGCRSVASSVAHVQEICALYAESDMKHTLVRTDDYIVNPKNSGYRSVHLVYRYMSDKKEIYNNLQIEVQLRSRLQHAWATAVETVGTFLRQSLKASQGSEQWLRFFSLMGSALALRERTPVVPETPTSKSQLVKELKRHTRRLDVKNRLETYGATLQTLQTLEGAEVKAARYFLLELRPSEGKLIIRTFASNELDKATGEYLRIERSLTGPGSEAVLVSVDSLDALQRAYPNYYLDTHVFLEAMQDAIS